MIGKNPKPWRAVGLALLLAGCSDFSQHRIGGVRNLDAVAVNGPPKVSPALQIPNPPAVTRSTASSGIEQASFVPKASPPKANPLPPNQDPLCALFERARQRHASMESYIFRLRRRESVGGKKMPEELIRVALRCDPYSVHLKWLGDEGKGREAIYIKGKNDNQMEVKLAADDVFLMPAGMRWKVAADSPLAMVRSRYPITGTGFGSLIERYGKLVTAVQSGDLRGGSLKYLGQVKRPEFENPVEAAHQVLQPKNDPHMPRGGQRWWYFDAESGLPVLVIAHDPDGEVEYYCHDHIQWNVRLDDDDFNADKLWKK